MEQKEYIQAYNKCLAELKEDFQIISKAEPNAEEGSYYDYLAKIGKFYFTHRDFAEALVSGEHAFFAFSRDTALRYIKKHKKSRYEHYKQCKYSKYEPKHYDMFSYVIENSKLCS